MKYLKSFEGRRKLDYKYLEPEDRDKILNLIIDFIKDKKILENSIDELTLTHYVANAFEYKEIWVDLFSESFRSSVFGFHTNIYNFIDSFHIKASTPAIRNTMTDIFDELYMEYDIESKLDKQLIKIFESQPTEYKNRFDNYEDYLTRSVTNACEWMLSPEKYNL